MKISEYIFIHLFLERSHDQIPTSISTPCIPVLYELSLSATNGDFVNVCIGNVVFAETQTLS